MAEFLTGEKRKLHLPRQTFFAKFDNPVAAAFTLKRWRHNQTEFVDKPRGHKR
ncbi:hypothetical protein GR216_00505 [Rhizobium leguminosarum]|nr:hypothetical protein [Rhizobium ruizarguesonis]MBY5828623.1 hypothetical protein [Rhizobium leguminosarum]MBY5856360.1 hypothetical protein [Rhizobium leguminosarum]NEI96477.1 hypothetical protein [Rhizobium ruizarguesonis]NEJ33900.1 hypothetical protein [Rhizobium ruizarguesonis]